MTDNLSRFIAKVALPDDPDGCWEWTAAKSKGGYGRLNAWGYAHRFSCATLIEPIPDGMCVCHTCDNRGCVNPNHLWVGTNAANLADMRDKGRDFPPPKRVGESSGQAKLTAESVRMIRASTKPHTELARELGVTPAAVRFVRIGRTWRHVE